MAKTTDLFGSVEGAFNKELLDGAWAFFLFFFFFLEESVVLTGLPWWFKQ